MDEHPIDRRTLLKGAGMAAVAVGLAPSCARTRSASRLVRPRREFARVKVSPDRVIRTVVGLRPYRPSGFVVRAERLDGKTVVHNYGHGGRGVTLSWGTSHLAVEEALKTGQRQYAVIGCGAVGLATARLLQRRGADVTIYARDLPPNTTSDVAQAAWDVARLPRDASSEFREQHRRAERLSYRYFQDLVGDYYGVHWIESFSKRGSGALALDASLRDMHPGYRELGRGEHPFGQAEVARWFKMLIEPPIYLRAVMRDFSLAGGRIVVRDFPELDALLALPEPVLMNCTGLGAKALFGDEELIPAKGQLVVLLPQPEIDYLTDLVGDMAPRKDGILLGSTWQEGVWTLEPDPEATERIISRQTEFFGSMRAELR